MPDTITFDFDLFDPKVQDFIEERSFDFWEDVSGTTKGNLKRVFNGAVESGETLNGIANEVNTSVFDELTDKGGYRRVRKIARTETTIALNSAANEAYTQSGVKVKKSWLTSGDEVVRSSHRKAEGEGVIDNDKKFSNGLMYPGDPNGELKEIVNCRCTLVPEVDEKEAKRVNEIITAPPAEGYTWTNNLNTMINELPKETLNRRAKLNNAIEDFMESNLSHIENQTSVRKEFLLDWFSSTNNKNSGLLKDAVNRLKLSGKTHFHKKYIDNDKQLIKEFKRSVNNQITVWKENRGISKSNLDEIISFESEVNKAYMNRVYGNKKIKLYRGVKEDFMKLNNLDEFKVGDSFKVHQNSLSSWSENKFVAKGFGDLVFEIKVKVKDIYNSLKTNKYFGDSEGEFVLKNISSKKIKIFSSDIEKYKILETKKMTKNEKEMLEEQKKKLKVDAILDIEKDETEWLSKNKK